VGRLASYTQQLHSISVNHSPNLTPTPSPYPTNPNPNPPLHKYLHKSAECTKLLFHTCAIIYQNSAWFDNVTAKNGAVFLTHKVRYNFYTG